MVAPEFFNPEGIVKKHGDLLPHWQQGEVMQFITFRLGDALPKEKVQLWLAQRKVWLTHHPRPWNAATEAEYHKEFTWRLERWLDRGAGSCLLRESAARSILADVLMKFQGERYEHQAWVIMPNHVHLLCVPRVPLEKLIQAWKSKSASRIGKGHIWQRNYRDTLIRDADHFANAVRYIRNNPTKAKLPEDTFTLWQSPRAQRV
ncbi:transposase [Luteolibacter arcticus]|uniref:Transposase n=1 Tax=Luteolibacter arcticus TaxID=1581411 RepID=A0ABT3GRC0_9BACT|nr:transposase [Luteolibacter arcticus]MCW1926074.1 transposase [Luteolibacter arcticus]